MGANDLAWGEVQGEDGLDRVESYVRKLLAAGEIGHDYKHVDRVRRRALQIGRLEGYPHPDRVEAAALLHDIGLVHGREHHGEVGADMAAAFLRQEQEFSEEAIHEIVEAIRCHDSLEGKGSLAHILRDADILDMLGPVGLMRAFTSKAGMPEYDPANVKGDSWGFNADQFSERFVSGEGMGDAIVDQINFQISCFQNLRTEAALEIGWPLAAYMREFLLELEAQLVSGGT